MSIVHSVPFEGAGKTYDWNGQPFTVEDWFDRLAGGSWQECITKTAVIAYVKRVLPSGLPEDDEVLYGKSGGLGYLVHISELGVREP